MRILIVSDIHANPAALAAVREPHDVCLCLGDLVEYGPSPTPCLAWVREHAKHTVRGNHDHGVAQGVDVQGVSGFRYLTMASRQSTATQLGADDRRYLARLPTSVMTTIGGKRFLLVHASPRDPLDEYVPTDPAAWAAQLNGLRVDYLCVGHTHQQFTLAAGGTTVVNPGSIGLQRDGDPRARYAVIDDDKVELKRAEYDVDKTIAAVHATDMSPLAKRMLADVYRTGRYVHPPELPLPPAMTNGAYKNGYHANGNGHSVNGNGHSANGNGHAKPTDTGNKNTDAA
ncbi:metallophosphoesterase family protein [Fimbriiglobus ruber]|uniref:Calcineurin-like phosphoesterase domain-containing protein n=1 Tax=Fimbriiglobus ruber TaxID=1908690 RepID=A0A225E0N1_9BACT|nr:metallophosphoesterase family protein [Fimbriiglobus ruber]OWK43049.1 hypothetical protein FRUB_02648 [Fimbriiglobus ruber]